MKKQLLALCLAALLALLPGCGRESGETLRADLEGQVTTLDPQFSTSQGSQTVLLNLFEGLMVRGADGSLRPGAAESYEISGDGLTYTFRLREGAVWDGPDGWEAPVTAADFVFAFRRIFDPQTPSPWAGDFSAIRGAEDVLAGVLPKESLGVRAADDDTLVITLSEPSPTFLEQLAEPGALPGNEEFFQSTRARYGQSLSYIAGNGPFTLSSWDSEALVLRPSAGYAGEREPVCASAVLYTGRAAREGTTAWQLFLEGDSDSCLGGSLTAEEIEAAGFTPHSAGETVWALVFRQEEGSPLASAAIRRALVLSVDREGFGDRVPEGFGAAGSLIPDSAAIQGQPYRELASGAAAPAYDPDGARQALAQGLGELELESLPKLTLLVTAEMGSLGGYLQRVWQEELGQYINLEMLDQAELEARVSSGDYQMAVAPLPAGGGSPMDALGSFSTGASGSVTLCRDAQFDQLLDEARTASTPQGAAELCAQCEELLYQQGAALPLFSRQEYYAVTEAGQGIGYWQGRLSFAG